jgi:nitrogen fixation protein FixH
MKFKWNWGKSIFLFFTLYVLFLASFFFYTLNHQEGLVTENYYEKDLKYQKQIERIKRTLKLGPAFSIKYDAADTRIIISFPPEFDYKRITGKVKLYRPSDISRDFALPVKTDSSGIMKISAARMIPGLWKIKVNWQYGSDEYYGENSFTR